MKKKKKRENVTDWILSYIHVSQNMSTHMKQLVNSIKTNTITVHINNIYISQIHSEYNHTFYYKATFKIYIHITINVCCSSCTFKKKKFLNVKCFNRATVQ